MQRFVASKSRVWAEPVACYSVEACGRWQDLECGMGKNLSSNKSVRDFGCVRWRWLDEAVESAETMQYGGTPISRDFAYRMLHECTKEENLGLGRRVQSLMTHGGLDSVAVLADNLIRLFTFCGSLVESNQAFRNVVKPTPYTWNAVISAHAKLGQHDKAMQLYARMQREGAQPDKCTFLRILQTCSSTGDIGLGKRIHEQIIENGLDYDILIGNTLVDMYSKCGNLQEAREIFGRLQSRSVVSWNAIIAGHVQHGESSLALEYFENMQDTMTEPDKVTFLAALKACSSSGAIKEGRHIHEQIIDSALVYDNVIGNSLIDMYCKCGELEEAQNIFEKLPSRDTVSWNAMIAGLGKHGDSNLALQCFQTMQLEGVKPNVVTWGTMIEAYIEEGEGLLALECFEKMQNEGVSPSKATFLSILKACGNVDGIKQGKNIHELIIKHGLSSDTAIANALIDMYAKCGNIKEAYGIFENMSSKDIVSWNAIITTYARCGDGLPALECFQNMQINGLKPNKVTFSAILKACCCIGAIEQGRLIHEQVIENGLQSDIVVGNTLVDLYARSGNFEEAHVVGNALARRDVLTWGSIIAGHAQCGNVKLALECLDNMQCEGIKPDGVIFASILAACSHAGLVDLGVTYFKFMSDYHSILPDICHYTCMVDLLSRSGYLNEAENLLQTIQPDVFGWTSLLTACRTYGNVELGRRCFDKVVHLDPVYAGAYVIMSGIYSDACMSKDAVGIEQHRWRAQAWKKPAKAWIEVNENVHEFIVGDKSHPQSEEIYAMLKRLSDKMKEAGYAPKIDSVLKDMSDEDKEDALCGHCEKLAIAFGLISTPPDTIIQATKNLRVCMDCHSATKIISKIEGREIIIRDIYRLHHFKNGVCSCGDLF